MIARVRAPENSIEPGTRAQWRRWLAAVQAAQASGAWSELDAVESLEVPEDLAKALADARASDNFAAFPPSARRETLAWIHAARKPETRAKRIAHTAHLAAMNIRVHQSLMGPKRK